MKIQRNENELFCFEATFQEFKILKDSLKLLFRETRSDLALQLLQSFEEEEKNQLQENKTSKEQLSLL